MLQLSDFGSSRGCQIAIRGEIFTQEVCTLQYRSPEVLLGLAAYNDGLDCWSMLCTLYERATGRLPFNGDGTEIGLLLKIFLVLGKPTEATWPGVTGLRKWSDQFPDFQRRDDILCGDVRPSPYYRELLNGGLIMDPAQHPVLDNSWRSPRSTSEVALHCDSLERVNDLEVCIQGEYGRSYAIVSSG